MKNIYIEESPGQYRKASDEEIINAGKCVMNARLAEGRVFDQPSVAQDFFKMALGDKEREVFTAIFLDNRHRMIAFEELFFGTIDGASVHPREVVKSALKHNAAAVILGHNHPSGVEEPSRADIQITARLKDALALVDVRILDHMIVGKEVTSMAERGLV